MQNKKMTPNALAAGLSPGTAETLQELNGQLVRRITHAGTSGWFTYLHAEAFLLVSSGMVTVEFRDESVILGTGDSLVIPRKAEYRLVTQVNVTLLVFEARFAPAFRSTPYQTPGHLW